MKNKLIIGLNATNSLIQVVCSILLVKFYIYQNASFRQILIMAIIACSFSLCASLLPVTLLEKPDGFINVDTSDPNKDKYLLALNCEVEKLKTKKNVRFKVLLNIGSKDSQDKPTL